MMRRVEEEGALVRQPEMLKPGALEGECGRQENGLLEREAGCDARKGGVRCCQQR